MSGMVLRGYEAKVMKAWYDTQEDFDVLSFARIAYRSGIDRKHIRRAVRSLARKGVTKFYQTSWTDEGEPHGAGYGLTPLGRAMIDAALNESEAE